MTSKQIGLYYLENTSFGDAASLKHVLENVFVYLLEVLIQIGQHFTTGCRYDF